MAVRVLRRVRYSGIGLVAIGAVGALFGGGAVAAPAAPQVPALNTGATPSVCADWDARIDGLTGRIVALRTQQLDAVGPRRAAIGALVAKMVGSRREYQALWRAGCTTPRPAGGPAPSTFFDGGAAPSCAQLSGRVPACVLAIAWRAADGYGVARPRVRKFVETSAHAANLREAHEAGGRRGPRAYVVYMAGDFLDPESGAPIGSLRIDVLKRDGAITSVSLRAPVPLRLGKWRAF